MKSAENLDTEWAAKFMTVPWFVDGIVVFWLVKLGSAFYFIAGDRNILAQQWGYLLHQTIAWPVREKVLNSSLSKYSFPEPKVTVRNSITCGPDLLVHVFGCASGWNCTHPPKNTSTRPRLHVLAIEFLAVTFWSGPRAKCKGFIMCSNLTRNCWVPLLTEFCADYFPAKYILGWPDLDVTYRGGGGGPKNI